MPGNEQDVVERELGEGLEHRLDGRGRLEVGQEVDGVDGRPVSWVIVEQLDEGFDGGWSECKEFLPQLRGELLSGLSQQDRLKYSYRFNRIYKRREGLFMG